MKQHVTDRIAEYVMNELDRTQKAEVESHLEECTTCREEFDALLRLWSKLGTLPEEHPSPAVRTRFYTMLEAYQEGTRNPGSASRGVYDALNVLVERFWPSRPIAQLGVSLALVAAGVWIGTTLTKPSEHDLELAHLRNEVQHVGRLLTVSLLSQSSASERLRGVSWTSQFETPDPQVLDALVEALKYDPNVNVRLASVDALGKFLGDAHVASEVVDAIPSQSSPLVQIALVDLMVREGVKSSESALRHLVSDPKTNASVKKRAEEGIAQLSL